MHENVSRVIKYILNQLDQSCGRIIRLDIKSLMADINYKLVGCEYYYDAKGIAKQPAITKVSELLCGILLKIKTEHKIISFEDGVKNYYGAIIAYKINALTNFEDFVEQHLNIETLPEKVFSSQEKIVKEKLDGKNKEVKNNAKESSASQFSKKTLAFTTMAKSIKKNWKDANGMWNYLISMAEKPETDDSFRQEHGFTEFKIVKEKNETKIFYSTHNTKKESKKGGQTIGKKRFIKNYPNY